MSLGRLRRAALQTLRRATELAPADANAHRNLAVALAEGGDLPAAADHAARAVSLAPGDGSGHELLGRILLSRGRTGEGQQELDRARTLAGHATP